MHVPGKEKTEKSGSVTVHPTIQNCLCYIHKPIKHLLNS